MSGVNVLVVAKAPVRGRVKTRLAASTGPVPAARIAASALLDTADACARAVGVARCWLALEGRLDEAEEGAALCAAFEHWSVAPQCEGSLGDRIADAFLRVGSPTVQIGMDTPQVTPLLLRAAIATLDDHDAVLGSAEDGGWWLLGLRDPAHAVALVDVPMSTPATGELTRQALEDAGLRVASAPVLADIDEIDDLHAVVAQIPGSRTAGTAAEVLA
ncbi:MAG: glycosyltransferase [Propionibacteriales bacterium]|nr:glycosyltransferase [Propionibacteriales bacterium]